MGDMPELPEVETVKRGLDRLLPGHTVASVKFDSPKSFPNSPADVNQFLRGARVLGVRRRAKVLLIDLTSGYTLVTHLKMTGQLVFDSPKEHFGAGHPNDSLVAHLPDKSTRVTLGFEDGSSLFFNDQRKFGWMRLLPTDTVSEQQFIAKLGPEPLEPGFTWQVLRERLKRRARSNVKSALLDQTVLAGVGNIYADEALWGAKIHPSTLVGQVSARQIQRLHQELLAVLRLSIDQGGSSNHTYVDAEGNRGSYMKFANVFRREGQPCPRCGTTIAKLRVAGRGTHICPNCQQLQAAQKI
jgi:formamidopyrimidine-DNA glycosylase